MGPDNLKLTDPVLRAMARLRPLTDWSRLEGGASEPQLFAARGEGPEVVHVVAKLPDNPQGLRVLANEWLGAKLLDLLGAPHPPVYLLEVPDACVAQAVYTTGAPLRGGLAFATAYLAAAEVPAPEDLDDLDRPEALARIALFDTWTGNVDVRQLRHMRRSGGGPGSQVFAVDQGGCFGGAAWTADELDRAPSPVLDATTPALLGHLRDPREALREALEALAAADAETLLDLTAAIPEPWGVGASERAALTRYMLRRREPTACLYRCGWLAGET